MLLNKGLITDTNELKQPANSWRKAVNLFWNKSNLLENENGFDSFLLDNAPYIIGIIETPDKAVLFVYTSTSSNIFTVNESGVLTLKLNLVSPVNRSSDYNKVIEMFEWEIDETVKLTQKEFNEYIHDETSDAVHVKMLNSTYLR